MTGLVGAINGCEELDSNLCRGQSLRRVLILAGHDVGSLPFDGHRLAEMDDLHQSLALVSTK